MPGPVSLPFNNTQLIKECVSGLLPSYVSDVQCIVIQFQQIISERGQCFYLKLLGMAQKFLTEIQKLNCRQTLSKNLDGLSASKTLGKSVRLPLWQDSSAVI